VVTPVTIVSVNVAVPSAMGALHRGRPVRSGIDKRPVSVATLCLGTTNLEGDGQADLSVHGGADKAVYAYPSDHFPAWESELGVTFGPGAFGENLTVAGVTEDDVCVGDRWSWGDAVLEVCQPRTPCFKLALHRGTSEVGRRMRLTGQCGWYLRVLRTGTVPTTGLITTEPHPEAVSIRDISTAASSGNTSIIVRALRVEALATEWREPLIEAMAR
jgi:MOSC domain-containing protein YiiM